MRLAISSFTHRIDRPCENTTCQTRLSHDVMFLRRREGRVTQEVFDALYIAGILTGPEAGRCMAKSMQIDAKSECSLCAFPYGQIDAIGNHAPN